MVENDSEKLPKVAHKFRCEMCDYNTSKRSSYLKHLQTDKHQKIVNDSKLICLTDEKLLDNEKYQCICGKEYKYDSGYYRHKKTCTYKPPSNNDINSQQLQIMLELIKDNKEIKDFLLEQNKQMIELAKLAGSHNTNNSHNKFNINMFLNEKCKDAINISEFVNQLTVSIEDLEETGRLGFADGISKIFINGLNKLEVYDRPMHCNDAKREVLYIKDADKWTKEDNDKPILTKAIKDVAHKNMKQIMEWQKINIDYNNPDSKQNDKYLKIVSQSMSGASKEESEKNYTKIIKKLVKETVIPDTEK